MKTKIGNIELTSDKIIYKDEIGKFSVHLEKIHKNHVWIGLYHDLNWIHIDISNIDNKINLSWKNIGNTKEEITETATKIGKIEIHNKETSITNIILNDDENTCLFYLQYLSDFCITAKISDKNHKLKCDIQSYYYNLIIIIKEMKKIFPFCRGCGHIFFKMEKTYLDDPILDQLICKYCKEENLDH